MPRFRYTITGEYEITDQHIADAYPEHITHPNQMAAHDQVGLDEGYIGPEDLATWGEEGTIKMKIEWVKGENECSCGLVNPGPEHRANFPLLCRDDNH